MNSSPCLLFSIGGMSVTLFGICVALSLFAGYALALRHGRSMGIRLMANQRAYLAMMIGAMLGARLLYVIINVSYYIDSCGSLLAALRVWQGGYSVFGGVGGAVIGLRISIRKRGFRRALDTMIPSLLLVLAGLRLSEIFTWQGRGMILESGLTFFPFAISNSQGMRCIAVCIYEAAAALLLLPYALRSGSRKRSPGETGFTALMIISMLQVPFESMRRDDFLAIGFVKIEQIVALVIGVSIAVIFLRGRLRTDARPATTWGALALIAGMIGLCVFEEFEIDGSPNPLLNYAILFVAAGVMIGSGIFLRQGWKLSLKSAAKPAAARTNAAARRDYSTPATGTARVAQAAYTPSYRNAEVREADAAPRYSESRSDRQYNAQPRPQYSAQQYAPDKRPQYSAQQYAPDKRPQYSAQQRETGRSPQYSAQQYNASPREPYSRDERRSTSAPYYGSSRAAQSEDSGGVQHLTSRAGLSRGDYGKR